MTGPGLQAIAPNLFCGPAGSETLLGGRRRSDGRVVFPLPQGPEGEFYEPVELAREGTLWSYTIQRFRPKSPPYAGKDSERDFRPYAVGYVELPGQVIVETRIETVDPGALCIGMKMRLHIVPFERDGDREPAAVYAFSPVL